ncbi:MAG: hypothetical protein ACYSWU_02195, partial [Planctomycetota bacterium]
TTPGYGAPETPADASGARPIPGFNPLKLDVPDDVDESIVKPLNALVDHMNNQMRDVAIYRQQVQKELHAANLAQEVSQFDTFVAGLGDEWKEHYGTGATLDMDPNSPVFKNRMEVFFGAQNWRQDAKRRRQHMNKPDSWKRGHHAVNWDRVAELTGKKTDAKVDRRRQGFSEQPTSGKPTGLSPKEEAIRAWTK